MMLYPEYNQIEILKGVKDRGNIFSIGEVRNFHGQKDIFTSMARYKDAQEYIRENGKIKGYDSLKWYDFIVIDYDELSPQKLHAFAHHLFFNYNIPLEHVRIYFSGNKGFHVYIPSSLFGLRPAKRLNKVVELIVREISDGVIDYDHTLYDANQVIRLVNTIHGNSGLYKIPIEISTLLGDISKIRVLAGNISKFSYPQYPTEYIPELFEMAKNLTETLRGEPVRVDQDAVDLKYKKLCYHSMMKGVKHGGRDETTFRLACHFRREGYDVEMVLSMCHAWNRKNVPPLSDSEVNQKVLSAFGHVYDFGCNDPVLMEHCNKSCYLWKGKNNA